jgi:serine/threonine protein kinase
MMNEDTAYRIAQPQPQQQPPQPQPPLEETEQAVLEDCIAKPNVWVLSSSPPQQPLHYDGEIVKSQKKLVSVDVMKAHNPTQAYLRIPSKPKKLLDHHAPGWGCVYFGIVLRRVYYDPHCCSSSSSSRQRGDEAAAATSLLFQEPSSPEQVEYVAIKRLRKSVVRESLAQGKQENPYKEIQRMQQLGDNLHVLGCIEALQDETYLYIVMPYCQEGSLVEHIPWQQPNVLPSEEAAQHYFWQLLENLIYLRSKGICHRDLSPDNCMLYNKRLVLTDLAMSFRIPPSPSPLENNNHNGGTGGGGGGSSTSHGGTTTPMGGFGKPAYLPPEVFFHLPFDATACDVWSAAVILFNLLTGEILYEFPHPSNLLFRYFLLARGIASSNSGDGCSSSINNERTVEILMELEEKNPDHRIAIWNVAQKVMALNPKALQVLDGVLRVPPRDRWSLEDILQSPWVQQGQPHQQQQPRRNASNASLRRNNNSSSISMEE